VRIAGAVFLMRSRLRLHRHTQRPEGLTRHRQSSKRVPTQLGTNRSPNILASAC